MQVLDRNVGFKVASRHCYFSEVKSLCVGSLMLKHMLIVTRSKCPCNSTEVPGARAYDSEWVWAYSSKEIQYPVVVVCGYVVVMAPLHILSFPFCVVESMLRRTYNDSFMIYIILHVKQTKKQIKNQTNKKRNIKKSQTKKQTNRLNRPWRLLVRQWCCGRNDSGLQSKVLVFVQCNRIRKQGSETWQQLSGSDFHK